MKKILFIAFAVISVSTSFAQKIQFPESFKYDSKIIPEMKIAKITEEVRENGIFKNPAVLTSKEEMQAVVNDYDLENVTQVYIEIYEEIKKDNRDDAGVIVTEFNSKDNLEYVLPTLYPQSNYVYLTIENYLILVWNDGRNSDERLRKSVDYYQKKIGAKEFVATSESPYAEEASSELETSSVQNFQEEFSDVATVADSETFTNLGFGTVHADLLSFDEIVNIQNYIEKFQQNYNIQVGVQNIGKHELSDDMMEGYAFHLVSLLHDEKSIKNNILILFDEVQHTSFVYFGTETGKTLNKLPMEKFKNELNQKLEKGEIYKGLNKLLMEFEIGLINASGQAAKVPSDFNQ